MSDWNTEDMTPEEAAEAIGDLLRGYQGETHLIKTWAHGCSFCVHGTTVDVNSFARRSYSDVVRLVAEHLEAM